MQELCSSWRHVWSDALENPNPRNGGKCLSCVRERSARRHAWDKLPPESRKLAKEAWEADDYRQRFYARLQSRGDWNGTPHRLWICGSVHQGYGNVRYQKKMRGVHVVAWELANGPVPEGLVLDHLCRVRICAEVTHLEPVTNVENIRRGSQGKWQKAKTQCPHGHDYTPENTILRPYATGRQCRECSRIAARIQNAKRKARLIASGLPEPRVAV